tara:strand:+ start:574 stop:975 length:402 start_codon:yes stop_codon:yes gene_type:complete
MILEKDDYFMIFLNEEGKKQLEASPLREEGIFSDIEMAAADARNAYSMIFKAVAIDETTVAAEVVERGEARKTPYIMILITDFLEIRPVSNKVAKSLSSSRRLYSEPMKTNIEMELQDLDSIGSELGDLGSDQ